MQCGKYICSGVYAIDEKNMYTRVHGHIGDCSEFIRVKYNDIVVSSLHMN